MLSNPDISLGGVGENLQVIRNIFIVQQLLTSVLEIFFILFLFFLHQFFTICFLQLVLGEKLLEVIIL